MEALTGNRWRLATVAAALVLATGLVTGLVVANWGPTGTGSSGGQAGMTGGKPAARPISIPDRPAAGAASARPAGTVPTQTDVADCNRYAAAQAGQRDKTWEVAKDAIIGGAVTAGIGAAGGAIAGGGKGAGKGAAIGGIVGAAAGTLYGINENRKHDEAYRAAYASCLRARGYAG